MAKRVHLRLEIELEQPIRGVVQGELGRSHRFEGWLELNSALAAVCDAAAALPEETGARAGGTAGRNQR